MGARYRVYKSGKEEDVSCRVGLSRFIQRYSCHRLGQDLSLDIMPGCTKLSVQFMLVPIP